MVTLCNFLTLQHFWINTFTSKYFLSPFKTTFHTCLFQPPISCVTIIKYKHICLILSKMMTLHHIINLVPFLSNKNWILWRRWSSPPPGGFKIESICLNWQCFLCVWTSPTLLATKVLGALDGKFIQLRQFVDSVQNVIVFLSMYKVLVTVSSSLAHSCAHAHSCTYTVHWTTNHKR
jgi:hypothetical protein